MDFHAFMDGSNKSAPSSPQNLNRYNYVGNNPLVHVDPTGHTYSPAEHFGFVEGIGAAYNPSELLDSLGDVLEGSLLHELDDLIDNIKFWADLLIIAPAIIGLLYAFFTLLIKSAGITTALVLSGLVDAVGMTVAASIASAATWLVTQPWLLFAVAAVLTLSVIAGRILNNIATELKDVRNIIDSAARAAYDNSSVVVIEPRSGDWFSGHSIIISQVDSSGSVVPASRRTISVGYWSYLWMSNLLGRHPGS